LSNQPFCALQECIPKVKAAMQRCILQTGAQKMFAICIETEDPWEIIARGKYVLQQFGHLATNCSFLVGGPLSGHSALSVVRRAFPGQMVFYGGLSGTSFPGPAGSSSSRGYSAYVHSKVLRLLGASGVRVSREECCEACDQGVTCDTIGDALQLDDSTGVTFAQCWEGMKTTTLVLSGAPWMILQLPFVFEGLGHSNIMFEVERRRLNTSGVSGGTLLLRDLVLACKQAEAAWFQWRSIGRETAGGHISLANSIIELVQDPQYEELFRVMCEHSSEADHLYPGWRAAAATVETEAEESARDCEQLEAQG